ncbi:GGDEF domain-containing protein [Pleionea sp. CnH1-48]|uniref:tetratricopeptide repeat-containing diguanylate cyclase n=1 Tax=Pleionea sp. CnH1-48 TaxID=2954494 RepID=UPI0020983CE7|nr:GGDEF domain-containing protein [Pleionea sp. CnH1-48]MCO7223964.1 diguanylate cyclase [Pleionea sp. CnH1-48]
MSCFRLITIILLCSGITLSGYADVSDEKIRLYGLDGAKLSDWEAIRHLSYQDPFEAIRTAREKVKTTDPEAVSEVLYGQLLIASIYNHLHQTEEALDFVNAMADKIHKVSRKVYQGEFLVAKAHAEMRQQNLREASNTMDEAIRIFEHLGANESIAGAHIIKGMIVKRIGNTDEAMEHLLRAYHMFQEMNNAFEVGHSTAVIANIHFGSGKYTKALEYYLDAMTYIDKEKHQHIFSILSLNVGLCYLELKEFQKAKESFDAAFEISLKLDDKVGLAYVVSKMGDVEYRQGKIEAAIKSYEKALAYIKEHNDIELIVTNHIALATAYASLKQFTQADKYIDHALDAAQYAVENASMSEVYLQASKLYEQQDNYKKALSTYKKYVWVMEENHRLEDEESLSELMMEYDSDAKAQRNKILQQENMIKQSEIDQKVVQQKYYLAIIGLSLLLVVWILFSFYRQIKINKQFRSLALTDDLTGAPNRRHIMEYARRQFKMSKETATSLTIAMLDLDHFKKLNDQYGHDIGDKVLQAFYEAVKDSIRSVDRVGRMGGEEWLIVMPGIAKDQMSFVFHRIRKFAHSQVIDGVDDGTKINFSMGVAQLRSEDDNIGLFIKRADDALYRAKENGRNQWSA